MPGGTRFNPLDTIPEVLCLYGLTLAGAALIVGHAEHWSPPDAMWWTLVTATTTGYGDMAPKTDVGRMSAAALMILAWVFNVLLTAQVAAKLIVNSDAWTHQEQEEVKVLLRKIAGEDRDLRP